MLTIKRNSRSYSRLFKSVSSFTHSRVGLVLCSEIVGNGKLLGLLLGKVVASTPRLCHPHLKLGHLRRTLEVSLTLFSGAGSAAEHALSSDNAAVPPLLMELALMAMLYSLEKLGSD